MEDSKLTSELQKNDNVYLYEVTKFCIYLSSIVIPRIYDNKLKNNKDKYVALNLELYDVLKKYTNEINDIKINESNILSLLNMEDFFIIGEEPNSSNNFIYNYIITYNYEKNIEKLRLYVVNILITFCIYYILKKIDNDQFDKEMCNELIIEHIAKLGQSIPEKQPYTLYNKFSNRNIEKIFKYFHSTDNEQIIKFSQQLFEKKTYACSTM